MDENIEGLQEGEQGFSAEAVRVYQEEVAKETGETPHRMHQVTQESLLQFAESVTSSVASKPLEEAPDFIRSRAKDNSPTEIAKAYAVDAAESGVTYTAIGFLEVSNLPQQEKIDILATAFENRAKRSLEMAQEYEAEFPNNGDEWPIHLRKEAEVLLETTTALRQR